MKASGIREWARTQNYEINIFYWTSSKKILMSNKLRMGGLSIFKMTWTKIKCQFKNISQMQSNLLTMITWKLWPCQICLNMRCKTFPQYHQKWFKIGDMMIRMNFIWWSKRTNLGSFIEILSLLIKTRICH